MDTISDIVSGMRADLAAHAEDRLWSQSGTELVTALEGIAALRAQLLELELRILGTAQVDEAASACGATSTAAWWAHRTRQTVPAAKARAALASGPDSHEETRAAMCRGDVAEDQARVIVEAVDALPADLDAGLVERAEKELLAHAATFDAIALRRIGKTILDVVAPDIAEEELRKQLEAEERALRALLALLALLSPAHRRTQGLDTGVEVPGPRKRGEAFAEYVSHHPADTLPTSGGVPATVVVTMTMDDFTGDTEAPAWLDTGHPLTATQARRLACEAGIVPAVVGRDGEVLDLGRQARFHTKAQRLAIGLRDECCTVEGCDRPPGMCEVHHWDPWSQGGVTSVENGGLLCGRHHTLVHHPCYRVEHLARGPGQPFTIRITRRK